MFPHTSAWFCQLSPQSSKVDFSLWREHTCKSTRRLSGSKRRLHKRAYWIKRSNAIFTPENLRAAIIPAWFPTCDQATHRRIIKSKAGESISKPEGKSKWNLNNLSGISSSWPFCGFLIAHYCSTGSSSCAAIRTDSTQNTSSTSPVKWPKHGRTMIFFFYWGLVVSEKQGLLFLKRFPGGSRGWSAG